MLLRIQLQISKVEDYDAKVLIQNIDLRWIKKFHAYIDDLPNVKSVNTSSKYIKFLKTILRQAAVDSLRVDPQTLSYRVPKVTSLKTALTIYHRP